MGKLFIVNIGFSFKEILKFCIYRNKVDICDHTDILKFLLILTIMPTNEIIRYSDKELQEFDAIIDEKLDKARSELEFYTQQLQNQAENADSKVKGLDDGITTAEIERLTTLASRHKKHIKHLENAKLRIQNKVYGICRETKQLISKERLKAVPHATLSIKAKQTRKKR